MSQNHKNGFLERIKALTPLVENLLKAKSIIEKIDLLNTFAVVIDYLKKHSFLEDFIDESETEVELVIKAVIAIGEAPIVFRGLSQENCNSENARTLYFQLLDVEKFYDTIGGIVGYHLTVLKLLHELTNPSNHVRGSVKYLKPHGIDLSHDTQEVRKIIIDGIRELPQVAEIYPLGGAGDRLMLKHETSQEPLPAALLQFLGMTLVELNIRDLSAREYLYYKLFKKQLTTPIAMMTSNEKNNRFHIFTLCEQHRWFSRPRTSYMIFNQPLAPMISKEGHWCLHQPLKLVLKPGGHGVIWKLALDSGVYEWLKTRHYKKAIVRQINNPIAGIDYGILGLIGQGCITDRAFGFASCDRLINSAEGMNVLVEKISEKKTNPNYECCISNIEYTEFTKKGIEDIPCSPGSSFSAFPANTNILFLDLNAIKKTTEQAPLPGMVLNVKTKAHFIDASGKEKEIEAGRLETTMQNIADNITDHFDHPIRQHEQRQLKTFLTYNLRRKTISVTKKSYSPGQSPYETPESCFYDLMHNHWDLLTHYCHLSLPEFPSMETYLKQGPSFIFLFHPALGPLWQIIAQKIRGGTMAYHSEMQLEIAELDLHKIDLNGSLHIRAGSIMGEKNTQEILKYSERSGKCVLSHVKINNKGMDYKTALPHWRNPNHHHECLKIYLRGTGEFFAENVNFNGNWTIEVPDGHRTIAYEKDGKVQLKTEKIAKPTWYWNYRINDSYHIILEKQSNI